MGRVNIPVHGAYIHMHTWGVYILAHKYIYIYMYTWGVYIHVYMGVYIHVYMGVYIHVYIKNINK